MAARTSSSDNVGKSARISRVVAPSARLASTVLKVTRVPLNTGSPPRTRGLRSIRSAYFMAAPILTPRHSADIDEPHRVAFDIPARLTSEVRKQRINAALHHRISALVSNFVELLAYGENAIDMHIRKRIVPNERIQIIA